MIKRAALTLSVLSSAFFPAGPCHALSLRSSAAEMTLGDVRPGTIAVVGASGPLSVENTGTEKATLEASVTDPPEGGLRDGYDPLPLLRERVSVKGPGHALDPGEKAELDVRAAIPASLEGGQYQFDCLLRGLSPGGSALTLRTAVTLSVGEPDPPEPPREPDDSGFGVFPAKARLEDVPIGGRTPARSATFRALKLTNAGDTELVVRATSVRAWDESVRIEDGYAPAPNPRWLKTGPPLRVKPGGVAEAAFALEIPGQKRYRGRSWAFVVAVDAQGGGRVRRTWWTLYVRTKNENETRSGDRGAKFDVDENKRSKGDRK